MSKGFPDRKTVDFIKKEFPARTRVRLLAMDDVQAPPVGTRGTVLCVDDTGSLIVDWDGNNGSLHVVYGVDIVRKISG